MPPSVAPTNYVKLFFLSPWEAHGGIHGVPWAMGPMGGFGRCAIERRTCPKAPMGPQWPQERLMTTPAGDPQQDFFSGGRKANFR